MCSIVLIRKTSGGLDLLTEARVEERFAGLRADLPALYAGYYVAELLGEGTQDADPHPGLFDDALTALRRLAAGGADVPAATAAYETAWLRELGVTPVLDRCAACGGGLEGRLAFSPLAGGAVCGGCAPACRDRRPLSAGGLAALAGLAGGGGAVPAAVRDEVRQVLGHAVASVLGRRPRLAGYLGAG